MGERAILIYGDPDYYGRYGFVAAETFGIANEQNRFQAACWPWSFGGFAEDAPGASRRTRRTPWTRRPPPHTTRSSRPAKRSG